MEQVQLEEGINVNNTNNNTNDEEYIDCFGRKRTKKEIEERDDFRKTFLISALIFLYLFSTGLFTILALINIPSKYKTLSPEYIIFSVFACLFWSPVVIGILYFIFYCCYLTINCMI